MSFAWQKTKEILFPFEPKRWLKIFLVVWLAGHAAGLGGNLNTPRRNQPAPATDQTVRTAPNAPQGFQGLQRATGQPNRQGVFSEPQTQDRSAGEQALENIPPELRTWISILFILFIVVVLPIALFFAWLSARFNFIFLELITQRDVRVKEAFRKYKRLGNSYFKWMVGFGLSSMVGLLSGAALIAFSVWAAKWFLLIIIPFLIFLIGVLGIIMMLVHDFVLPMMYQDGSQILETVKKFISSKPSWKDLIVYALLKLGFGILSGLLVLFVSFLVGAGALLVGLLIGFAGSFLAGILSFLKPLFFLAGILLFLLTIFIVIILIGLITLPIPVFFRTLALAYFPRIIKSYNLLAIPTSGQDSTFNS